MAALLEKKELLRFRRRGSLRLRASCRPGRSRTGIGSSGQIMPRCGQGLLVFHRVRHRGPDRFLRRACCGLGSVVWTEPWLYVCGSWGLMRTWDSELRTHCRGLGFLYLPTVPRIGGVWPDWLGIHISRVVVDGLIDLRLGNNFVQRERSLRLFGRDAEGATKDHLAGCLDCENNLECCHDGSSVAVTTVQQTLAPHSFC